MEHRSVQTPPAALAGLPVGHVSNQGTEPYSLEAQSSTGFVAWRLAEGETLVSRSTLVSIRPTRSIEFWSCAGFTDTTPAGTIRLFDCHGCGITRLDACSLAGLEYLDASFNKLAEIRVDGLTLLQVLNVEGNKLSALEVRWLKRLRLLNCAGNQICTLDLSGLGLLARLEYSGNPIELVNTDGCTSLKTGKL